MNENVAYPMHGLVTREQFPRTGNLEYAILKCHLIVEFALTEYIVGTSYVLVTSEKLRFSFSQKLEVAILNGFGNGDPVTIPSVEILNQIRNQVAHRFTFDRGLLTELVKINSDDEDPLPTTDRQYIAFLRRFCAFLCGKVAGYTRTVVALSGRRQNTE